MTAPKPRTRRLTFRDHILLSVPREQAHEVMAGNDLESVLVLVRRDAVLVCECRDGYADVTRIAPGEPFQPARECNTTDHVTRMWEQP